jgi:hypothetical protein
VSDVPCASDLLALRRLVDEFAIRIDRRDYEGVGALFLEDGEFVGSVPPGSTEPAFRLRGPAGMTQLDLQIDPAARMFHFVGNHLCDVEGDRASGETYCLSHHYFEGDDEGATVTMSAIRYEDVYARTPNGWRFASRHLHREWRETRRTPFLRPPA